MIIDQKLIGTVYIFKIWFWMFILWIHMWANSQRECTLLTGQISKAADRDETNTWKYWESILIPIWDWYSFSECEACRGCPLVIYNGLDMPIHSFTIQWRKVLVVLSRIHFVLGISPKLHSVTNCKNIVPFTCDYS